MKRKQIYTAFISCAIALNVSPLQAEETSRQDSSNSFFVCATQDDTPTMYAYTPGEVNLTPVMSWHPEYLLPGQSGQQVCQKTAMKLQASLDMQDAKFIKAYTDKKSNSNLVCLVEQEDGTCASQESEKLFGVNPNYNPECVLSNKKPIDCMALTTRGIYSYNEQPYRALWWPW